MSVHRRLAGAALCALLLAACETPLSMSRDDAVGYNACRALAASRQVQDPAEAEELLQEAIKEAQAAENRSIRASVDAESGTLDEDALAEACVEAGFNPDDIEVS